MEPIASARLARLYTLAYAIYVISAIVKCAVQITFAKAAILGWFFQIMVAYVQTITSYKNLL